MLGPTRKVALSKYHAMLKASLNRPTAPSTDGDAAAQPLLSDGMEPADIKPSLEDVQHFDLLPDERSKFATHYMWSIKAINFYKGKAPVEHLEKRVAAIVDANKWLAGRMCYKTSPPVPLGPEPTQELLNVTIAVPLKVADPSLYFKTVSMPTLRPNTPPGEITQMLTESGLTIKPGFMVLDKDEPCSA